MKDEKDEEDEKEICLILSLHGQLESRVWFALRLAQTEIIIICATVCLFYLVFFPSQTWNTLEKDDICRKLKRQMLHACSMLCSAGC